MERWEIKASTKTTGAHIQEPMLEQAMLARYPVADANCRQHSVFTSASGDGAQAWTSPTPSQQLDTEEELVTFGNSPFSLEDDPQV